MNNREYTMQLHTAKQEALDVIQRLPETSDMEEIMYHLYVLENVRRGQHDTEQGNSRSAQKVLDDIQAW
jgi:hypothetical protein